MSKTKKNKKTKHKSNKKQTNKRKKTNKIKLLPNVTPNYINKISEIILNNVPQNADKHPKSVLNKNVIESYAPSINKELVTMKSINREQALDCNNEDAFNLREPLKIGIPGKIFGKTCVVYSDKHAKKFLLKNLSANKHVEINKIIPPKQSQSNCWFNTMFVSLFISDKGRKFFHFFRQLMILGTQANGDKIPEELRNGFALLNYGIDASLTGNKYAYIMDTNAIIRSIYDVMPEVYKDKLPFIVDINESSNPIRYYLSLLYYLHNKSVLINYIPNTNNNWKEDIIKTSHKNNKKHIPDIIVLEFYDNASTNTTNKPRSFIIKDIKYSLDSCIIRDTSKEHFSATLTCEGKEMAYDGLSFHRLVPLEWKKYINSNFVWGFDDNNNNNSSHLKWNFTNGYQMLIYYRVR